ncbi:hypothetical protein HBI24_069250 [Parastagonospora nodorum]|nr:hypothetical protein HBH69_064230 [Parastagonospora nodorum]KAH5332850.1 hypothetical protein HBI50_048190 [Parastagonospora nodorum]KAH5587312.1 hypothetical protein HBI24_069250 [Parastagonospora nodorum]KAH5722177.1 hypothetical protein HBI18_144600 [Parastagonospora nodorum]
MAEWRITEDNPIRDIEGLDHERCAALHNYIIELGWTQRGLSLDALDKRTWWECHSGDAALTPDILERLEPAVISFLKAAWHGYSLDESVPQHCFHRYLGRLGFPDNLFNNVNYAEWEDDSNKRAYISLYLANWALGATHPQGLILAQENGVAIQHMSLHNTNVTMNGRMGWLDLEVILDRYIEMIEQGKVVAVDDTYEGEQERISPWIMPSYTQLDLDETLEAFGELVNAISSKMPSQPPTTEPARGLLDLVTGGNPQMLRPHTLAHKFLCDAPVPSFTHIAPGLRIATQQPFASASDFPGTPPLPGLEDEDLPKEDPNKIVPLLLFSSTLPAHQETIRSPWGEHIPVSSFTGRAPEPVSVPAGMYLTCREPYGVHPFEDGCKLLLSYTLGANGFARTSDEALIGEDIWDDGEDVRGQLQPNSTDLYQLGYNFFVARHDVPLKHVLWKWVEMVNEGKWEVNNEGVVGGMDKWKEADTEEHWMDYQLPLTW